MTPRRFTWALRARGPDLSTWPEPERLAAAALLRQCPASRDALAESLANEDAPLADAAALARIMCPVQRALAPLSPFMRRIRWGALAVCIGAGLYVGLLTTEADAAADPFASLLSTSPATVLAALDR